jgi:signal peptidase
MRGTKRFLILCSVVGALLIAVFVVLHFLGVTMFVITGESMTGAIPKGSITVERRVATGDLQVGDVITFQPPGGSGNVTHRIISIDTDDAGQRIYQTKGDFNEEVDPWQFTLDRPVQAKVIFHIPWVGYVMAFFTLRTVRTALLALVALGIIVAVISVWRSTEPEDGEEPTTGLRGLPR